MKQLRQTNRQMIYLYSIQSRLATINLEEITLRLSNAVENFSEIINLLFA